MLPHDFYRCDTCGNVIWTIHSSGVPVVCCGEEMRLLKAGVSDGPAEKHVPYVKMKDDRLYVRIGSEMHPAVTGHHIEWIGLLTDRGMFFREIPVGREPEAEFCPAVGKPVAVYAYCNLHGLWKSDIK